MAVIIDGVAEKSPAYKKGVKKGEIVGIEKYITIVSTRDYEKSHFAKVSLGKDRKIPRIQKRR